MSYLAVVVLIALSAFFSGSEMSFSSMNIMRMDSLSDGGNRRAKLALFLHEHFESTLSTILIGNNLVNIAASSIAAVIAITLIGEEATAAAGAIMTILIIIFGETAPKIIAKKNPNGFALIASYPLRWLMFLFYPLVALVVFLVNAISSLLGKGEVDDEDAAEAELVTLIETVEDEGLIDEDRSELLQAALDFGELSAKDAMTARVDMVAIDIDDDWENILEIVENSSYSRLPVYEDSIDNIIGVLSLNHLLKAMVDDKQPDLRALMMPPCHVYKTVRLPLVLAELRKRKTHLAIVTDEYGGTKGVITMEDVLEQIVGDIWDETDEVEGDVIERGENCYEFEGDTTIYDLCEYFDMDEDSFETESDTVGGWTTECFGGFPKPGDSFEREGLKVTVLNMDGFRVERVLVERVKSQDNND